MNCNGRVEFPGKHVCEGAQPKPKVFLTALALSELHNPSAC